MKSLLTTYTFLIGVALSTSLVAQTPIRWIPEVVPSCVAGETITSLKDVTVVSAGCVDVELNNGNTTLKVTSRLLGNGSDRIALLKAPNGHDHITILPASTDFAGALKFTLEGDMEKLDILKSSIKFTYQIENRGVELQQITFDAMLNGSPTCDYSLPGGTDIQITEVFLAYNDTWVDDSAVEVSLFYDFALSFVTTISEVVVPDTAENPRTRRYTYELPTGDVFFLPPIEKVPIRLETNTPFQRQITIAKDGGGVYLLADMQFDVQVADFRRQQHLVEFNFHNVDLCVGNTEIKFDTASILVLNQTSVAYTNDDACLMFLPGSTLIIPENGNQQLGNAGHGLQVWHEFSNTEVRENATLVLDNIFGEPLEMTTSYVAPSFIEVFPGGNIEVTANTSFKRSPLRSGTGPEIFHVTLHEGAAFDMSAAPIEVQRLFLVNGVSNNAEILNVTDYNIFPNPTMNGLINIKERASATGLQVVEVLDISGKVISTHSSSTSSTQRVTLPRSGAYILRLTDVDGRVSHQRVLHQ